MKAKDIPDLKQKVLDMLPITQAEVWKTLGIGHRDGSKLINLMLEEKLIKKTKISGTFMIELANGDGQPPKEKNYSSLLNKSGVFCPCCGCEKECKPATCPTLLIWLLD